MEVTLIRYTNHKKDKEWWSLFINKISVAHLACQQIIGGVITELELNDHGIYVNGWSALTIGTAKQAFKGICKDLYKKRNYVMNYRGGHIPIEYVDWTELERKNFEVPYGGNIRQLILEMNGKTKKIEEI